MQTLTCQVQGMLSCINRDNLKSIPLFDFVFISQLENDLF